MLKFPTFMLSGNNYLFIVQNILIHGSCKILNEHRRARAESDLIWGCRIDKDGGLLRAIGDTISTFNRDRIVSTYVVIMISISKAFAIAT